MKIKPEESSKQKDPGEYFEHDFPCDPTSLVKWRKRIGSNGVEKFLEETIFLGQREGQIKDPEFRRVNVGSGESDHFSNGCKTVS